MLWKSRPQPYQLSVAAPSAADEGGGSMPLSNRCLHVVSLSMKDKLQMSAIDPIKKIKLEQEGQYLHNELIETISKSIMDNLIYLANKDIFSTLGGELTYNFPLDGAPNARAIVYTKKPNFPVIEIRLSLLREIYRDSFIFPILGRRIVNEIENFRLINEVDMFHGQPFIFENAFPEINEKLVGNPLLIYVKYFSKILKEKGEDRISENDVRCRFLIFELMLTWTFFHELSHIIQGHHRLSPNEDEGKAEKLEISEMDSSDNPQANVPAQAKEVLADLEAVDLLLNHLQSTKRLNYVSLYLMFCSTSLMFQRFYNNYQENLDLTTGKHPHPVIRDDYIHNFTLDWISNYMINKKIVEKRDEVGPPLAYFSVRASLLTGLIRANRIENFDGTALPSYMNLSSRKYHAQKIAYQALLKNEIKYFIKKIKPIHLRNENSMDMIETSIDNTPTIREKYAHHDSQR